MRPTAFNIKKLMEDYQLDERKLADVLFPEVNYKIKAIRRVINNKQGLSLDQAFILASYVGIPAADLFSKYFNN